ncbi:MAG: hypothetical protein EAZ66_02890 [Alphaproteobacteria bacterium]|nr:MAG: hypothetical protein EAZ66_02890 [Alphaproteobacteria bacterium]
MTQEIATSNAHAAFDASQGLHIEAFTNNQNLQALLNQEVDQIRTAAIAEQPTVNFEGRSEIKPFTQRLAEQRSQPKGFGRGA